MRWTVARSALAAALLLVPLAHAPARAQDFSITNQIEPANATRRDIMRQLQAWWDVHGYYPRHAANNDERGNVAIRLVIATDGVIRAAIVVAGSGSNALDNAATGAFRGGFVRPLPPGAPEAVIDVTLHYVMGRRDGDPVAASTAAPARRPFTITSDPVHSPILETMLQRTCAGVIVREGIRNHPAYGGTFQAQAVFFRRPDGSPWVKFYEGGFPVLSPVTEVGKLVQWTGREEHLNRQISQYTQYTVWPDGENKLGGYLEIINPIHDPDSFEALNHGGTVDLTCAVENVPAIAWSAWAVTPGRTPPGDPP